MRGNSDGGEGGGVKKKKLYSVRTVRCPTTIGVSGIRAALVIRNRGKTEREKTNRIKKKKNRVQKKSTPPSSIKYNIYLLYVSRRPGRKNLSIGQKKI